MNERQQSLSIMRKAYENKELGFQRGAEQCGYYDKKSDSRCIVGTILPQAKSAKVNIIKPFPDNVHISIEEAMIDLGMYDYKGLKRHELAKLQELHDALIYCIGNESEETFRKYLYSLK